MAKPEAESSMRQAWRDDESDTDQDGNHRKAPELLDFDDLCETPTRVDTAMLRPTIRRSMQSTKSGVLKPRRPVAKTGMVVGNAMPGAAPLMGALRARPEASVAMPTYTADALQACLGDVGIELELANANKETGMVEEQAMQEPAWWPEGSESQSSGARPAANETDAMDKQSHSTASAAPERVDILHPPTPTGRNTKRPVQWSKFRGPE